MISWYESWYERGPDLKMVWIGLLIICQMRRRRRAFILDQESFFCWTRFPICNPGHYQWIEDTLLRDGIITNTLITMWYPHHMALSIPVTKILNKLWYMYVLCFWIRTRSYFPRMEVKKPKKLKIGERALEPRPHCFVYAAFSPPHVRDYTLECFFLR